MKLYSVTRYRLDMYGEDTTVVPARNQRAAVALVRLLFGPGNWRATGPLDGGHVVDGFVRARLHMPFTRQELASEFDRVWAVWEQLAP